VAGSQTQRASWAAGSAGGGQGGASPKRGGGASVCGVLPRAEGYGGGVLGRLEGAAGESAGLVWGGLEVGLAGSFGAWAAGSGVCQIRLGLCAWEAGGIVGGMVGGFGGGLVAGLAVIAGGVLVRFGDRVQMFCVLALVWGGLFVGGLWRG